MSKVISKESAIKKAKESGRSYLDANGAEIMDPTPVELPVGFERPESIQETIRRLVTDPAIRAEMQASQLESFEEADDFDVEDELPFHSPYEDNFDPHHIATRDAEIRQGVVKDLTPEQKESARELAAKVNAHLSKPKRNFTDADLDALAERLKKA